MPARSGTKKKKKKKGKIGYPEGVRRLLIKCFCIARSGGSHRYLKALIAGAADADLLAPLGEEDLVRGEAALRVGI